MQTIERPLLLLHRDRVFQERVRKASSGRFDLRFVPDWSSLRAMVREAPPAALVVVDPYEGEYGRERLSGTLQGLLREFPSVTVLAACGVRPGCHDDFRRLGEWGVSRVISLDEEDTPLAIAQRLATAQGRPLKQLLQRALPASTSGRARSILAAAAEVVAVGGGVRDLARSLHVTTRTLLRWCRRAGLATPRRLMAWMRILLAAELLDDPGRSVLGVAYACGYSSDSALRNVLRRFIGITPKTLRRQGAFRTASREFLRGLGSQQR